MNRLKYLLFAVLLAVPLLAGVALAHAQSFQTGDEVTVPSGRTLESSLYASGSTIDIAGTVDGDVYCVGQNVVVSGTVDGDVLCGGQNVTISGTVTGDVRLAGQNVTIEGQVQGSASVAAQNLTLHSRGSVERDLSVAASAVVLNGAVGRDVAGFADTMTVDNTVGRNIQAQLDQLTLKSGARVGGNVTYTSANKVVENEGAQVVGEVTQKQPPASDTVWTGSLVAMAWLFGLYMLFALLLIALVLVLVAPGLFHRATSYSLQHIGKTLLVGLVANIVVPAVLFMLLFTVIGIPLALFGGLLWLVITLLAGPFAAYALGRLLLRRSTNAIWIMLLGSLVLLIVIMVPFIGWLISLLAFWFGLGTIILRLTTMERPKYNVAPELVTVEPSATSVPAPAKTRKKTLPKE